MARLLSSYALSVESLEAERLLHAGDVTVLNILYNHIEYTYRIRHEFEDIAEEDINDLVRETAKRIFERGKEYDASLSSIPTWMVANGRFLAIQFRRKHRPYYLEPLENAESISQDYDGDTITVVDPDRKRQAERLIAQLPKQQHMVLHMLLEGYSVEEIAEALGINTETVRVHRWRGLKRLGSTTR